MDFESSELLKKIKERLNSNKINFKNTLLNCPLFNKKYTNTKKLSINKTINPNNFEPKTNNNLMSVDEFLEKNNKLDAPTPKRIISSKNTKIIKFKFSGVENIKKYAMGITENITKEQLHENKIDDEINFNAKEIQDNFYKRDLDILDNQNLEEIRSKNCDGIKILFQLIS